MKLKKWIIVGLDDGVRHTCDTKAEAIQWCRSAGDDGRKHAGWKYVFPGFYEYCSSPLSYGIKATQFYVGRKAPLTRQGFDRHLAAYEQDKPLNAE